MLVLRTWQPARNINRSLQDRLTKTHIHLQGYIVFGYGLNSIDTWGVLEREENVKANIFAAYNALLQLTKKIVAAQPADIEQIPETRQEIIIN